MVSGAHPDGVKWERPVVRLMGESDGSLGLKLGRERRGGPRGRLEFLRGGAVQQTLVYKSDVDLGPLTLVDVFLRGQAEGSAAEASANRWEQQDAGFFLQSVKVKKVMENGLRSKTAVQEWNFPCFSFIQPGLIRHFFCGTFLPRKVPPTLAALWSACREETEGDHKTYRWQEGRRGLPRRVGGEGEEDLPADERSSMGHEGAAPSLAEVAAEMVDGWGLEHLQGDVDPWKSVYGNNRDLNETALAVTCFEDASVSNGNVSISVSDAGPSTSERPGSSGGGEGTSGRGLGRGSPTRRPQMPDVGRQETFRWRSDAEFGRQLHAGAHPLLLQQCREVPERLADIPAQVLSAILPKGLTLEEEAVEGRVFLLDLTDLEAGVAGKRDGGYMQARQKFVCAPACLLYQRSATNEHPSALLPLSIVLEPSKPDSPLLHPGVPERVWTLAKSFVACADAHYHFAISLYLETFVMLEPFVVAAKRELPQFHPLRRLFEPYFRGFLAESLRVRQALFGDGSAVDGLFALGRDGLEELVQGFSETWAPSQWNLPHLQASQGLEEANEELPYRDDGGLVWGCITDFVKEYLLLYYPTDDEVLSDRAVQAWYREGFLAAKPPGAQTAQGRKPPKHGVESREFLTNLVTSLIWARTGRRSALMGGIYDYNAFVPNRPWHLTRPPMLSKENIEEATYVGYLPSKADTAATVALCAALAVPFPKLPGTLLQDTVVDPEARPLLERFRCNLSEVEVVLQGRNGMRETPYPYLMPSTAGLGMEV